MKKNFNKRMVILVFFLFTIEGFAQFTPPPPPPLPTPIYIPETPNSHSFIVYLKNGEVLSGDSRMYNHSNDYYLKINKRKVYPTETDSILSDSVIIGYPDKKHWLFKTESGKISGYKRKPELDTHSFDFIEKGQNGKIKYTFGNLKSLIKEDEKASIELRNFKFGQVVRYSMITIGTAAFLGGFLSFPKGGTDKPLSELPQSKFIVSGAILIVFSWFPHLASKDKKYNALKIYNKNQN